MHFCRHYIPAIIVALVLGAIGTVCQIVGPDKLKDMVHACLESFEAALENVICHLDEDDTMLLLLGDYVHGGDYGRGVLDIVK